MKFQCPQCQNVLNIKDEMAGRKGRCPRCKAVIEIPDHAPPLSATPIITAPQAAPPSPPPPEPEQPSAQEEILEPVPPQSVSSSQPQPIPPSLPGSPISEAPVSSSAPEPVPTKKKRFSGVKIALAGGLLVVVLIVLFLGISYLATREQRPEQTISEIREAGISSSASVTGFTEQELIALITPSENMPTLTAQTGQTSDVRTVAFSPDGTYLAGRSSGTVTESFVKLWDLKTGAGNLSLVGQPHNLELTLFHPNGQSLALVTNIESEQSVWTMWDWHASQDMLSFSSGDCSMSSIAVSQDGYYLAGSCEDGTVRLWDTRIAWWDLLRRWPTREVRSFTGHYERIASIAFSPDGTFLASGSADNTIKLWDVQTGDLIHTFSGHADEVRSVAFRADGRYVVSGSKDKTVKIWDVDTGKAVRTFPGHTDEVTSAAFRPDGWYVVSGSWDGTITIWDVRTGKAIRTFSGHTGGIFSVAFSPDGWYLASGSADETLKIWDVKRGAELATLIAFDATDWVVMTPGGYFDASPGAMQSLLYWADAEGNVIEFDRYKATYHIPGLLTRLFAASAEG